MIHLTIPLDFAVDPDIVPDDLALGKPDPERCLAYRERAGPETQAWAAEAESPGCTSIQTPEYQVPRAGTSGYVGR